MTEERYPISQREREEQEYRADVMRRESQREQMGVEFKYLIVLSHCLDDFPLQLVGDRDVAFDYARKAGWYPPEKMSRVLELPECSTPCCIAIWTFRDGVPAGRVVVRHWEDEEGDGDEPAVDSPTPQYDCNASHYSSEARRRNSD